MIRALLFCLLLVTNGLAVEIWPVAEAKPDRPYVVIVRAGSSSGSGVCVWSRNGRSVVATCNHVISEAPRHVSANGVKGWTISRDPTNDVALLEIPATFFAVAMKLEPPKAGDPLWIVGFPSMRYQVNHGTTIGWLGKSIYARLPASPGVSGGPVFQGTQLAGIVWGSPDPWRTAAIAPAKHVQTLLGRFLSREQRYASEHF